MPKEAHLTVLTKKKKKYILFSLTCTIIIRNDTTTTKNTGIQCGTNNIIYCYVYARLCRCVCSWTGNLKSYVEDDTTTCDR